MTAQKTQERPDATARGRKPWKKKTPVEVVLEQTDVLRRQIAAGEQELTEKRKQLARFEQAKKIFEAP